MEKIILLGTSGAVANDERDNVSLLFRAQNDGQSEFNFVIECGGSTAHKLAKLGVPYGKLENIIITHTHLDHLYGLPGLIFSMIYRDTSRTLPLRVHCPEPAVPTLTTLLDVFELADDSSFPIDIQGVPLEEGALVLENQQVRVTSTPVDHSQKTPTIGIKIQSNITGKTVVYSSDTGYSERLTRLAYKADVLFHECSGLSRHPIPAIHSSALQVGKVAQHSAVKKLVLLHLDSVLHDDPQEIMAEAKQNFTGEIVVASDFDEYELW